jgi:hypothetical protein
LAAGAGLGGLLLVYAVIVIITVRRGGIGWFDRFVVINAIGFVVHGTALFFWLRHWNRIRTAPRAKRSALVVVCWVLPLVFICLFARYIR